MPIPGAPARVVDLGHLDGLDEAALATDTTGRTSFANASARRLHWCAGVPVDREDVAVPVARRVVP